MVVVDDSIIYQDRVLHLARKKKREQFKQTMKTKFVISKIIYIPEA
jgi:hypothetical protein